MSKNLLNTLLASASIALYYLIISPLYNGVGSVWQPEQGITKLSKLNSQYDDTLSQADSLYKQADSLQTQFALIPTDTQREVKIMIPDMVDPVRLISEVSTIANQSGFTLKDINYIDNSLNTNPYGTYKVSFSVTTTYTKFKELMHKYETSMRLFSIQSVDFNIPPKDEGDINFQVRLETYYMK